MIPLIETFGIDFENLAYKCRSELKALLVIDIFEKYLTFEQPLLPLLDGLVFGDFQLMSEKARRFSSVTRDVEATNIYSIIEILKDSIYHKDKSLCTLKLKELIEITQSTHLSTCKLLKIPQEEVEKKMKEIYEILDVFLHKREPTEHFEKAYFDELYGEMAEEFFEKSFMICFVDDSRLENVYRKIIDKNSDIEELWRDAFSAKEVMKFMSLPTLVKSWRKLQNSVKTNSEEENMKMFLDIVEQTLFIERYFMIKKFENNEPIIRVVSTELRDLLELRQREDIALDDPLIKIKKILEEEERKDSIVEEKKESLDSIVNKEDSRENLNDEKEREFSKVKNEKIILEPIFEEECQKNESIDNPKQIINYHQEIGNWSQSDCDFDVSNFTNDANNRYENNDHPFAFEETKTSWKEVPSNIIRKPRACIENISKEPKQEEFSIVSSPCIEFPNSELLKETKNVKGKDIDNLLDSHIIILPKKTKKRDPKKAYNDYDDYPFDDGLKCNII